jgi:hypothetical protein
MLQPIFIFLNYFNTLRIAFGLIGAEIDLEEAEKDRTGLFIT